MSKKGGMTLQQLVVPEEEEEDEESERDRFRRDVESCLTPPPMLLRTTVDIDKAGTVTRRNLAAHSDPLNLSLRPRAQTCVVRKKRRSTHSFDGASRLYVEAGRDDPLSPPIGLMGMPGSTQRKRSNVLFSRESSTASASPRAALSIVLNGTPPKRDAEGPGEPIQLPLSSTFGSVIPSEPFSDEKLITSPTYCDSDDSAFSEESVQAKPKTGFLCPQNDSLDPGEIIDECATEQAASLELFELELSSMPPEVYMDCVHITTLDLSNNDITSLGAGVGLLVNLEKLVAKSNSLTELPAEIGGCKQLTHLYLDQNQLRTLPETLSQLSKLEVVGLDWNEIQGFPLPLCSLKGLKTLYIVENPDMVLPDTAAWQCTALSIYIDNSPAFIKQADVLRKARPGYSVELNQIFPDEITPKLFLGSLRSAQEPRIYRTLGITYLASIGRELSVVTEPHMAHIQCNVDDLAETDLGSMFSEVHAFIEKAEKEDTGCLVHCFKGQSRSATMVVSYLMKTRRWRRDEAIEFVREKRPMINPNKGFMDLLLRYEKETLKL